MDPLLIITAVGVFVAACAFITTIWQAAITRKHNRMSVKPHLTTWTTTIHEGRSYAVHLMNNGLGPALITKYEVLVDGE